MSPLDSLQTFAARFPAYAEASVLDVLRATDYSALDDLGHVYLDYTGAGLFGRSQLAEHRDLLLRNIYGNPHSSNPTSDLATRLVDSAREEVLRFFNAPSHEYEVVFTPNASGALRLVGESYPFGPGGTFLATADNHNSCNGIREYARRAGAEIVYAPLHPRDLRLDDELASMLTAAGSAAPRLFAYPAQSNYSGVQHSLDWIERAHEYGWDVLLDAASFAPTNRLDLSEVKPDFVSLSFYKMFGYPTGIGALLARRPMLARLRRPWFAGGTIALASVRADMHLLAEGTAAFEDGTVDYLGIPAVAIGLRRLSAIGIDAIHDRLECLTCWLLERMRELRHANGSSVVRIFGPDSMRARGATIAFHVLDPDGRPYDVPFVQRLASESSISLRTGCFCNPGASETAHSLTELEIAACAGMWPPARTTEDCERAIRTVSGKTASAIRASLGLVSNFDDVKRFARFLERFQDLGAENLVEHLGATRFESVRG